jgi:hypothetical protein
MEGHPEISIFSKNQQFELPQLVAQAQTPIHSTVLVPEKSKPLRGAFISQPSDTARTACPEGGLQRRSGHFDPTKEQPVSG